MDQIEFTKFVADILERMGVNYMVVGSIASTYYGEARLTQDVDMVADLKFGQIEEFAKNFPSGEFYVSEDVIKEAIRNKGMFNIFHSMTGFKVDIFIPKKGPLSEIEMKKRKSVEIQGKQFFISAPEYLILKKLEYYQEGESEKHLRDIASMLKESGDIIDKEYIGEWVEKLGLLETWEDFLEKYKIKAGKNE